MLIDLSPAEQLSYCTTRIEVHLASGEIGCGTGFFFKFFGEGEGSVMVLVTNKHVVKDAVSGIILLHISNEDGSLLPERHLSYRLEDFEKHWIFHPDDEVDLCILPFYPVVSDLNSKGYKISLISLGEDLVADGKYCEGMTTMEDVTMIGYPIGLWDEHNNMPIFRRGVTATHARFDYGGRKEFMIDAACFPGSSGSPVLLFNSGYYPGKDGGIVLNTRMKLIGVLRAGPQFTNTGEIKIVDVPTQQKAIVESLTTINLGICIKAERLLEFGSVLKTRM